MKTLKYILLLMLGMTVFNSCLVDETTKYDQNADGLNLAGFEQTSTSVSGIADGTAYDFNMKVKVIGPTKDQLSNDITVTIEADPASTAVAGVHYRIDNPVLVLKASENHLGLLKVTMLTEGIETPLAEQPVLILRAKSADGDPMVTNNGKPLTVNMNFACFSEFQGTYSVTHTSSTGATFTRTEEIQKVGVEQYLTASVGTWGTSPFTDYGFIFENSCNALSMPHQLLANYYGNDVWSHKAGNYNPETGVITIYYTIEFAAGNREYTAVYTPVN